MINLGYMSSLRLAPGSALGEKLKVCFVNQKKKKEKMGREGSWLWWGERVSRAQAWEMVVEALLPFPLPQVTAQFYSLASILFPVWPFYYPPPPPAEPSPRLEPSSGNSNFIYQSPTFSKDPFFPSYINLKLKRSFLTKTPMLINWRHTSSETYILKKLFYLLDITYTKCPEMTSQSVPVFYFLLFFYFDICHMACGGKNTFSLKTERAVSVFQHLEKLSVQFVLKKHLFFLP